MDILVTGGAGFIGSAVVDAYIKEGHTVHILDNLSSGKKKHINPKASFIHADICDESAVAKLIASIKPNVINHHAAHVNVIESVKHPKQDFTANCIGTLHLLKNAVENNVSHFIYANTAGASYGEPKYLPVDEDHPHSPISPYGLSKQAAEQYTTLFHIYHNLQFTSLRYANVYGPRQDPQGEAGVVATFVKKLLARQTPTIYGDGSQVRDFVYISDVVDANLKALKKPTNKALNVASGTPISISQVYQIVSKLLNSSIKPTFASQRIGEIHTCHFNIEKAKNLLNWSSKISFEQGVAHVIQYWKHFTS